MNHFITQHAISFLVSRIIAAPRPAGDHDAGAFAYVARAY